MVYNRRPVRHGLTAAFHTIKPTLAPGLALIWSFQGIGVRSARHQYYLARVARKVWLRSYSLIGQFSPPGRILVRSSLSKLCRLIAHSTSYLS